MRNSCVALLLCAGALAQTPVVFRETLESAQVAWLSQVERPVIVRIDHSPAKWRAAYAAEVAREREAGFRVGAGGWATLHAGAELRFGNHKLPAGIWYLALHRDAKAHWSLAVLDPTKMRTKGMQPGDSRDVKPDLLVPMKLSSGLATQDQLQITLAPDDLGAMLRLRWGEFELSTAFGVEVARDERSEPAFQGIDEARAEQTASKLRYQELRPGVGPRPGPKDTVRVHYVGWLLDGTKLDATFDRKQQATFRLDSVIKGWQEGVQLMRPGAVFLFELPPALAYGDRGAPPTIPARAALVFWIELLDVEK